MTYKKIAQIANVSLSTVSKALSGSKEISEELRSQIIQIAIAEGYFTEKRKRRIEYSVKAFRCDTRHCSIYHQSACYSISLIGITCSTLHLHQRRKHGYRCNCCRSMLP